MGENKQCINGEELFGQGRGLRCCLITSHGEIVGLQHRIQIYIVESNIMHEDFCVQFLLVMIVCDYSEYGESHFAKR